MRRNQNFLSSANPRIISESNHPTRKRRSPFNVRNSSFSQNFIIKFRRKAESRADDADIFLGENLSFFYVRYRENGAPEISEILLRGAHRTVENFSLRRLKFSFGINILTSSYQPGHFFELFRTRIVGISRDAMQNRNFFGSVFSQGSDRLFNFLQRRESNRHYDRLSGFCNFFQKRKVSCFIRSNFIARHFHFFKKVHGGFVKRRREKNKSELFGKLFKLRLPVPGRISAFVKLIKIGAFPICRSIITTEKKPFFVGINSKRIGSVSLKLHRIRSRFSRRLNESNRLLILLAMIGRDFRDKKSGAILTNFSITDFKSLGL